MSGSDGESYFGVPVTALADVGRVVVGAGRLEWAIRLVAADLAIYPGRSRTSELLRLIRRAPLPAHARVARDEVVMWAADASSLLSARDSILHSAAVKQSDGAEWVDQLMHLRSGDLTEARSERLTGLPAKLADSAQRASKIDFSLRHNPRPGVFLPNTVVDGAWVPICSEDYGGRGMARPTDAEMDEWWRTLGPFVILPQPQS